MSNNKNISRIYNILEKEPTLWDIFTSKEEYNTKNIDEHQRIIPSNIKSKSLLYPHVSEYLLKNGFNTQYKNDKNFALVLSHDIDDIYVKWHHIFKSFYPLFKYRNFKDFKNIVRGKLNKKKSPYLNFKKIIKIEKKYDAKSSFYFLASSQDIFGYKYHLNDIEEDLNFIIDNECEIGLHVGYFAYDKIDEIRREKKQLEKIIGTKVIGSRNHMLRFKVPSSWEILSEAGIKYDTSFQYHSFNGFRNGMCHPFNPYNLKTESIIDILEIPLIVQDMTYKLYTKYNIEEIWNRIKNLIDIVEKNQGVMTVLWHNWVFSYPTSYAGLFDKNWTKLYEKILKYCYEKNAWITNTKELYLFNKEREILTY
jgi:peptidoglycan/xylan/chitin deacetylase (PgdA/CDA1 family)